MYSQSIHNVFTVYSQCIHIYHHIYHEIFISYHIAIFSITDVHSFWFDKLTLFACSLYEIMNNNVKEMQLYHLKLESFIWKGTRQPSKDFYTAICILLGNNHVSLVNFKLQMMIWERKMATITFLPWHSRLEKTILKNKIRSELRLVKL